jgi:hypothetical protein
LIAYRSEEVLEELSREPVVILGKILVDETQNLGEMKKLAKAGDRFIDTLPTVASAALPSETAPETWAYIIVRISKLAASGM